MYLKLIVCIMKNKNRKILHCFSLSFLLHHQYFPQYSAVTLYVYSPVYLWVLNGRYNTRRVY